ncbi:MAG: hypothetical protein VZQ98_01715 [Bacteroidales bacterium]|nr:hypothetical protein [Bacteroidales bacterium]
MKHIKYGCLLILSFSLILLMGENHAARYGNALLKVYHTLPFGLKLTYINTYIITDQNRESYLCETSEYSEMIPVVDSIVGYGYSAKKDMLSLYIYSEHKPLRLDYTSYDMVVNKTPVIAEFHSYDGNTILLREEPTIIYYWRAIAFVLILAMCGMTAWLSFYILRLLVKRFLH